MRGTVNESSVFRCIQALDIIQDVFEVGLFSWLVATEMAASPEGVAIFNFQTLPDMCSLYGLQTARNNEENVYTIGTIEIKTRISASSLNSVARYARSEPYVYRWSSTELQEMVPRDHLCQILHQCNVLNVNTALYACASETGLLFTVLIIVDDVQLSLASSAIESQLNLCLRWAHEEPWEIPSFASPYWKEIYQSHQPIWKVLHNHINIHGPLRPLRLIRNGCQALYSKLKCGVDCLTKFR